MQNVKGVQHGTHEASEALVRNLRSSAQACKVHPDFKSVDSRSSEPKKAYVPEGDFYIDMMQIDSIAQDNLYSLQVETQSKGIPFVLCRVETLLANKRYASYYEAINWHTYTELKGRQPGEDGVVDPKSRQPIDCFKAYIYDERHISFTEIYDSRKDCELSWNFNFYRLLSSPCIDPWSRDFVFLGIMEKLVPSLRTSYLVRHKIKQWVGQGKALHKLATDGLALAAILNMHEPVSFLLRHGADPDGTEKLDGRPIVNAAGNGSRSFVRNLLRFGASPNVVDTKTGESAMHMAAYWGDKNLLSDLILFGGNTRLKNHEGMNVWPFFDLMDEEGLPRLLDEEHRKTAGRYPAKLKPHFKEAVYSYVVMRFMDIK